VRPLRNAVGLHGNTHPVNTLDRLRGDDCRGRAQRRDAAVFQEHEPVAILGRQIQIVEHGNHGQAIGTIQPRDQVENRQLVRQIEMVGRLVEQKNLRLLSQAHGDQRPLPLAAAEGRDRPVGQVQHVGQLHRLLGHAAIFVRFPHKT